MPAPSAVIMLPVLVPPPLSSLVAVSAAPGSAAGEPDTSPLVCPLLPSPDSLLSLPSPLVPSPPLD